MCGPEDHHPRTIRLSVLSWCATLEFQQSRGWVFPLFQQLKCNHDREPFGCEPARKRPRCCHRPRRPVLCDRKSAHTPKNPCRPHPDLSRIKPNTIITLFTAFKGLFTTFSQCLFCLEVGHPCRVLGVLAGAEAHNQAKFLDVLHSCRRVHLISHQRRYALARMPMFRKATGFDPAPLSKSTSSTQWPPAGNRPSASKKAEKPHQDGQ